MQIYLFPKWPQGDDYDDCAKNALDTTKMFDIVGLIVHAEKSCFIPKKEITILDCKINSIQIKVFPASDMIKAACSELLNTPLNNLSSSIIVGLI